MHSPDSGDDLHHRLLNHISVVSSNAYLLRDSSLDGEEAEIVADIIESAAEAHALALQLGRSLQFDSMREGNSS